MKKIILVLMVLAVVSVSAKAQLIDTTQQEQYALTFMEAINKAVPQNTVEKEEIDYSDTDALESELERILKENNPILINYEVEFKDGWDMFNRAESNSYLYARHLKLVSGEFWPAISFEKKQKGDKSSGFDLKYDINSSAVVGLRLEHGNKYIDNGYVVSISEENKKVVISENVINYLFPSQM